MLNSDFILKRIVPYLNSKKELSEFEFMQLFSGLTKQEQYEVIDIMIANDIDYVMEKQEEKEEADRAEVVKTSFLHEDHRELMNLSNEQLCVMYQQGEHIALAALEEKNKRFIYRYALNLSKRFKKTSMTIEDLFQEGIFGLIKAAEKFDIGLDYSFLTYCGNWIQQTMSRAAIDHGYLVRLPVHLYEKVVRTNKYREKYPLYTEEQLLNFFKTEEIFDPPIDLETLRMYMFYDSIYMNTASLNTLVGEGQDSELQDFVPDEGSPTIEDIVEEKIFIQTLQEVLSTLTEREQKIIKMRFGLSGYIPMTLEEIGLELGVTRERIRQIEAKALEKLRNPSRSKKLEDFLYI